MNSGAVDDLRELVTRFLDGEDRSIALVNVIEALVIQEFSDAEFSDDLILSLSLYRPGGGDFLDGEEALSWELRRVLTRLEHVDESNWLDGIR